MSYLKKIDEFLEKNKVKKKEDSYNLDHILQLRLSELARREIAIKVYFDILKCEVWLCGNERMRLKVQFDDPEAITYTVREMRELIKMNPSPEDLKKIHNAKVVFPGSKIVDGQRREDKGGNNGSVKTVVIEGRLVKLNYDKEGGTITIQKNGKTYVALDFEPEFKEYLKYFEGGR